MGTMHEETYNGWTTEDGWTLTYPGWDPEAQPLREALCTLGNGYFATRGAAEEVSAGGPHYPGTYLAGGYNRLESEVAGRVLENEDLVNWPNWLCLSFRTDQGEWFSIDTANLLDFEQSLDVRRGLLTRRLRLRHDEDRITTIVSRRLVHMGDPHLAAIQWTVKPENWSGAFEIRSALDGNVQNQGVARYRELASQHLRQIRVGRIGEDGIRLRAESTQSRTVVVQAARTRVLRGGTPVPIERATQAADAWIEQRLRIHVEQEKSTLIEKVVSLYTSKDFAISEPELAATQSVQNAGDFQQLRESHERAWKFLWNRADMPIDCGESRTQLVLRLHLFHLLQTVSYHSIDLDVGVPSRGLHGEAYRGHIFWDELYIFPLLNLRIPELTRALLMYRYRRLPAARQLACDSGYRGAMYPWQSGSSGREESQVVHLNPESGRWVPDHTHRQRHINAAIAYNVWQYYQATGDHEFLAFYGAEMLCELARFWASIATYCQQRDRYEILDVVGPDEFHTAYPGKEGPGLKNNAYTNVLAAWVCHTTLHALDVLASERQSELREDLAISDDELKRWRELSCKMFVPFHDDQIISQFEGYESLDEFDWDGYRQSYGDIARLDRLLEAEGDSPNRYKASKQADVLMLFYLFSCEELQQIFARLGYEFHAELIPHNIEYYMRRTSHGSTLSRVVHSWVLARADRARAWKLFKQALHSDVSDIQGGTTPEGIHLGAMAGTIDVIQRCYTGVEMRNDVLWLNPRLPAELERVTLRIRYRGHWLKLFVTHQELNVSFEHGWSGHAKIGVRGRVETFCEGESRTYLLRDE